MNGFCRAQASSFLYRVSEGAAGAASLDLVSRDTLTDFGLLPGWPAGESPPSLPHCFLPCERVIQDPFVAAVVGTSPEARPAALRFGKCPVRGYFRSGRRTLSIAFAVAGPDVFCDSDAPVRRDWNRPGFRSE